MIDIEAAAAFLSELDPLCDHFTFQTFDDSPDKRKALATVLHGTLADHAARLSVLNRQGAGVFVTANETDLKGRAKGNIIRVRSLFVDHDTADPDRLQTLADKLEQWPPSCIVESSPGKHHFYWWASLPLAEFADAQARMIAWHGSDPAVKDLPRVMRLPGFYHQKGEPFRVQMIHQSGERYTAEQVREHLAAIPSASITQDAHSAPVSASVTPLNRYAQRALESATQAILSAPEGARNDTLNSEAFGLSGLVKGGHLPEQQTRETIIRAGVGAGLPVPEVMATVASAWSAAQPREIEARPSAVVSLLADHQGEPLADQEGRPQPRFALTPVSKLLEQPEPLTWLVRGYLLPESNALLFGASAAGKSLYCIAWAASVAIGRPWQGRNVKQGPVVYLAGEGHFGIKRRLKAWAIENNAERELIDAPLLVSDRGAALNSNGDLIEVMEAIDAAAQAHGSPALIVVDTLHRNMTGDENSAQDMGAYFNAVDELRTRYGATVLTVHHSGHNEAQRARGSSSIRAAMDAELCVEVKGDTRLLSCSKMKDAPKPPETAWNLKVITLPWRDDEGEPESSVVLIPTDKPASKGKAMTLTVRLAMESFLDASEGDPLTAKLEAWRDHFYQVHTGDSQGAKKKAFQRGREALTDAGVLTVCNDVYTLDDSGTSAFSDLPETIAAKLLLYRNSGTAANDAPPALEAAP